MEKKPTDKENVKFYDTITNSEAIYEEENLTIVRYDLITRDKLLEMDKSDALVLVAVSPLEVHGGFLPLGTDFLEARMMFELIKDLLKERKKDKHFTIVETPPLPIGWSGLRGMVGTIHIRHKTFRDVVAQYLEGFVLAGFKRILVSSAHHGNIHAYAIEEAALKVMKKHEELEIRIASPLNSIVKKLMIDDPKNTWAASAEKLNQPPLTEEEYEALNDDDHSSIMETSFVQYMNPELIDASYKDKEPHTLGIEYGIKKLFLKRWAVYGDGPLGRGYNGRPAMTDSRDWFPLYADLIKDVGEEYIDALYEKSYEDFMEENSTSFFYGLVFLSTGWRKRAVFLPLIIIIASLLIPPLFPWNLLTLLYFPLLFLFVFIKIRNVLNQT